ncbi:MAG: TRAP transporter small permease [Alphaproteobacteria bacterium]|nr:TRAP transporter small permease [Alphaproteobacteria bacterium]
MTPFLAWATGPLVDRLRTVLTAVSVALLAGYFFLVLLQVFFRYVLNESLFWAEELVRGAMLWGVMISVALVAASRAHIRIEILELMLPPAGRRFVVGLTDGLTLAFCLTLMWAGIQFVDRTWFQNSPLLDVPKYTVYLAIPVGAALESLMTILTWQQHEPSDEPTDRTL